MCWATCRISFSHRSAHAHRSLVAVLGRDFRSRAPFAGRLAARPVPELLLGVSSGLCQRRRCQRGRCQRGAVRVPRDCLTVRVVREGWLAVTSPGMSVQALVPIRNWACQYTRAVTVSRPRSV